MAQMLICHCASMLLLSCQIKHGRQPVVKLIDLGMSLMYDPKKPITGALKP